MGSTLNIQGGTKRGLSVQRLINRPLEGRTLTRATIRTSLDTDVMLSKRSQTRKPTWCMVSFMGNIQNRQVQTDRRGIGGGRGLAERGLGEAAIGSGFLFESMKTSRMMNITVMIARSYESAKNH